jgi:UDP-sulfoquinovose synthase
MKSIQNPTVLILGGDGYLGWPTAMFFAQKGWKVVIVDNLVKRHLEQEVGVSPLNPLPTLQERVSIFNARYPNQQIHSFILDIANNYRQLITILEQFRPSTIVHYAEQPSAPYSMIDHQRAVYTQVNNVVGTLNLMFAVKKVVPDAHIIKLGTMGEYGTPNISIEEGWIDITHEGRKDRVLFPKRPGSFYHLSKVHDSHNLEFGCRVWDLRVTDLNQGVVYGIDTDESSQSDELRTSFHYDAIFGTVINRFVAQAVLGSEITVYGRGGQTRGYLNIVDTLQCVELAALTPPQAGEFRVFNQFTETFSVLEIAKLVKEAASDLGMNVSISKIENPRIEMEDHFYSPKHSSLPELGLKPTLLTSDILKRMLNVAGKSKGSIQRNSLLPNVSWRMR